MPVLSSRTSPSGATAMTELADLTIAQAVEAMSAGEVSALEITDSVLARHDETEPSLHAFAVLQRDAARHQAEQVDRRRRSGEKTGPLAGIPFAVKEAFDVRGLVTSVGSRAIDSPPAADDAEVVSGLKRHGAVLLGHTVAHELGFGANIVATRNAWHPGRAPGGSSAGSAVAVAAGSAFAALGTDTGGSVRVPAALNGVVGLKPGFGRVGDSGMTKMAPGLDTVGIITRSVGDAGLVFEALTGERAPRRDPRALPARIAYFEPPQAIVASDIVAGFHAALSALGAVGHSVEATAWPDPGRVAAAGVVTVFSGASAQFADLLRRRSDHLDPGTLRCLLTGSVLPPRAVELAERVRVQISGDFARIFSECRADVLAMPSFPVSPGEPHDITDGGGAAAMTYAMDLQMVANLAGLPAITIPCGLSDSGMPMGISLLGRARDEALLLQVAEGYELHGPWGGARPPRPNPVQQSAGTITAKGHPHVDGEHL